MKRTSAGVVAGCVGLLWVFCGASPGADFSAWSRKLKITFSGYDGTAPLTNFPALIALNEDC